MKKIQALDEYGRSKAMERYAEPKPQTKYGHSQIKQDIRGKFDTPMPKGKKGK